MVRVGLLFIVAAWLTGCGDAPITLGLEQPFVIQDGQFVEGDLPGRRPLTPEEREECSELSLEERRSNNRCLRPPRTSGVTAEVNFLYPGIAGVAFSGWASNAAVSIGAKLAVSVDDEWQEAGDGYWVFPTGPEDPAVKDADTEDQNSRVVRFVADFHQSLPVGRQRLLVTAFDADGNSGTQEASNLCVQPVVPDNGNACNPTRRPPGLVVSLHWDTPADLDLILVAANGDVIEPGIAAFGPVRDNGSVNFNARGAARRDIDSNHNCVFDGRQRENIIFENRPRNGRYRLYVNLNNTCGAEVANYTVSLHRRVSTGENENGQETYAVREWTRHRKTGTLVPFQANGGTSRGTFVTEFRWPN